ncbi:MAG: valine--tRNA ligase [Candidatus Aenigmarchaeota archaeon]|nr:valine--tRNA ligase [Candidatus Aenigmarchaeota archaeon]
MVENKVEKASDLPKHYDPHTGEKKWREFWWSKGIFKFDPKSDKSVFSIDNPPIYTSGIMHIGHGMSYAQFDFIAHFKRMCGFNVFLQFCFDDNGLPTEKYVEKKFGVSKHTIDKDKFIKMCKDVSTELAKEYKEIFKMLGFSAESQYEYKTINDYCQKQAQRSFLELYKAGEVYRKEEPTIWCPYHETALAQAEVETAERETTLNYVKFDLIDGESITIATTRPELLASCVAIFVNPNDERYRHLIGKKAKVPIFDQEVEIMADEEVDPEFGTGIVMVSTFGDRTDVEWWKKHKLPMKISITKDGLMNELTGRYKGMKIEEARKKIIEDLKQEGRIEKQEKLKQNVGVCWRCGTPVEFIPTKQWFIKILDKKDELIEVGRKVKWFPEFYRARYEDWVKNLKWDWCISRQRYYGIPIPVWYCGDEVIVPDENELPVDPTKKEKICPNGEKARPETDVFDTWMTSSLTPLINARWKKDDEMFKKLYPMSLRPNAHDIIRTWIFYTIVKSWLHTRSIPWKEIMISGHGLDPKGKKMSKSKGNVIILKDVLEKYGADVFRYWAGTSKLGEDLPFQEKDLTTAKKLLNKLWNAFRFAYTHLKDYEPKTLTEEEFSIADRWILTKLSNVIEEATEAFEKYEYSRALKLTKDFFWHDLCDNYLEMIKRDLYNEKPEHILYTLYTVFLSVIKLFAPFLSFITEEIYQSYFRRYDGHESVHLSKWPEPILKDEDALRLGELAKEIISKLREYKVASRMAMNAELARVKVFYPEPKDVERIKGIIQKTMNIKEVVIEKDELRVKVD